MLQQERKSENKSKLQMNSTTFWQAAEEPVHTASRTPPRMEANEPHTSLDMDQGGCMDAVLFLHGEEL